MSNKQPENTDPSFWSGVSVPGNSLFSDAQMAELLVLGPEVYKRRKRILEATPADYINVLNWLAEVDSLNLAIYEIVCDASAMHDPDSPKGSQ